MVWKGKKDRTLKDELHRSVGAQYAIGDQWRNNSRKNEETEPKQKQYPGVDMTGDGRKVQCCKEQYCIGTWNDRSMSQGKLDVAKQEMVRMNINILGSSELKWTGMGEFKLDNHYIYYCQQESLRRNGVAIMVNKWVWNAWIIKHTALEIHRESAQWMCTGTLEHIYLDLNLNCTLTVRAQITCSLALSRFLIFEMVILISAVSVSHSVVSNSLDLSLPGSSVHGIIQAPRDRTWVSSISGGLFTI